MVCIYCNSKTDVINSRLQKRNNNVWRRRKCHKCGAVFTTHEQVDLSSSVLVNSNGKLQPFNSDKLYSDVLDAVKDNQRPYHAARELTGLITQKLLQGGSKQPILAQTISLETAGVLKRFNKRAWMRYSANHPSALEN